MATNLLESYKNRLAICESVHQRSHNGAKMSANKKLVIASVLNNTSKFMNEAFDNSGATQRSALGDFKKFCLNVSTVALPNLILPELMLTQPMTSITGYVTYLRYSAGISKGGVDAGDVFNTPYSLGKMTEDRARYTSSAVVEAVDSDATTITPAWTPVANTLEGYAAASNTWEPLTLSNGSVTVLEGQYTKIRYVYDNISIPQADANGETRNSVPTLKASMNGIALRAHARRIAVHYSQIAAFQAKTDYGYDLGETLATQAQGELAYEIDTEGVYMLINGAELDNSLKFKDYESEVAVNGNGVYISRSQYYEQFSEIIARAKQVIYRRTQKFAPNYMICGTNILTILPYVKGWNAAPVSTINGPYFAGTIDGLKVFVSPAIDPNQYVFGVNGGDLQTSAAIYAPYMAIVPTQLLGFSDGTMSQGFSTMYDMKLLSTYNVSEDGLTRTDVFNSDNAGEQVEVGKYSWLLVKGEMTVASSVTSNTSNIN